MARTRRFKSIRNLLRWRKKHRRQVVKGVTITTTVPPRSLGSKALKLAGEQLGIHESPAGSNHTKFGVWYGLDREPWCAIFVSWVLSHVGRAFHIASVPQILTQAKGKQNGLSIIQWSAVQAALRAGNVVLACYDWPGESKGVPDHVGFVHDVVSSSAFHAIEGNTASSSNGSQSNGGEVCLKLRPVTDVEAFVLVR